MRAIIFLISGLLCLVFSASSVNAQSLQEKISLKVEKAPLPDVLQQIQKDHGLRFSYLNNELAGDTVLNFHILEKPVSEVLDKLMEDAKAGYRQHNGQIIIKKVYYQQKTSKKEKTKSASGEKGVKAPENHAVKENNEGGGGEEHIGPEPEKSDSPASVQEASASAEAGMSAEGERLKPIEKPAPKESAGVMVQESVPGSVNEDNGPKAENKLTETESADSETKRNGISADGEGKESLLTTINKTFSGLNKKIFNKEEGIPQEAEQVGDENPVPVLGEEPKSKKAFDTSSSNSTIKPYHVGIVYPLSNHGTKAPQYVNRFSAHILVGVAAGLEGLEFSGVGTIDMDTVKGFQYAGVFNLAGRYVEGAQVAGLLNYSGGSLKGAQFSGALNFSDGDVKGGQFSGFGNFMTGDGNGVQAAGFINTAGSVDGGQVAGFLNLSRNMDGLQAAGFLNIADEVKGGQIAGFMNKASQVDGAQISGFINTAKKIKGSQIGVFNFADSMQGGIPIGFLSFIKNGYRAVEVYTAEDFHANVNFKTGVPHFYNILTVGVELNDNKRWGYGYGIGSEWTVSNSFRFNTDVISYQIVEGSYEKFPQGLMEINELNNLYKVRVLGTLQIGRKFALFGGPTYNIAVSRYKNTAESSPGSQLLVDNVFFDRTYKNKTNVKMWFGFNAGLRF